MLPKEYFEPWGRYPKVAHRGIIEPTHASEIDPALRPSKQTFYSGNWDAVMETHVLMQTVTLSPQDG